MSDKTCIFIDGGYLDRILKDEYSSAKIDFSKLVENLSDGISVLRSYYYHCPPYQSNPPTDDEKERTKSTHKFYSAIERLPNFEVRRGKLAYRGTDANGERIFMQKRVDILLGVDLVLLSAKQRITHAVILTGDSDFLPAIEIAKNEGVNIKLVHGSVHPPHDDLIDAVDQRQRLTSELINTIIR